MLGAGLYWLLLPCTLLAGELEGAGRKAASGSPLCCVARPREGARGRAQLCEAIPRDSPPRAPAFLRRERAGDLGGPGLGTGWIAASSGEARVAERPR